MNVAIFASGSGSNAENIIRYFEKNADISFFIVSNKQEAFVHERAKKLGVPSVTFSAKQFRETDDVLHFLQEKNIDFIVLAGFLLKIPGNIIAAFPDKIVNIHPALLPKFGGKGMYGSHVHEAVVEAGEKESGITVHYINAQYDEGEIIFQARCEVLPSDSADDVAEKVHALEYLHFPKVIAELVNSQ
ncbi:MAG: phosphoribosylglycinamide formyltransferase [Prevotellaceae bacterium]|jgi:phosphoribosylglycinamide formyltransferase-1|nr:phosphoribosylglycinamide formyltransferase [Prevotellaceae bacterium]